QPLPDIIGQFDSALNGTREVMVTVGGRTEEQNRQLELAMNAYDQATEAIYKHEAGLKVLSDEGLAKAQAQQAAANSEIERLQSIVGDTTVSLQDMTQEQRNQYIQTIAGTYGMNALNSLLAEGAIGWEEMEAAVGDAATMQETAAARTQTLDGAMEALGGVAESFRIKIGTALIPVLTTLADIGATLLEKYGPTLTAVFEQVSNGIQHIIDVVQNGQLGELFTIFEDGSSVLGGIFESFGMGEEQANNLATGISNVVTNVQNFITPVAEFVQNHGPLLLQILGGLAVAFGAFTIITTVVGWIGGLIGAISGIGAAITAAGGGITGIVALLGGPLTLVIGAIAAAVGLFAVAWRNDWGGIQGKVQEVIAVVQPLVEGWLTNLSTWWSATWPQLQAVLETVWGVIQSVIESAIAVIGPAVQTFLAALGPIWEQLKTLWPPILAMWEAAKPVLLAVLAVIGAALATAVGLITGIITGLSRAIGPIVQGIIGAVRGIVMALTGVFQTLTGVFRLIVGLFTGNGELIKQAWEDLKNGVTNIMAGLLTAVISLAAGLVEGVIGFVSGLVDGVVDFFKSLYDQLVGHSIVTDLVERIQQLWEDLWTLVGDIVEAGVKIVTDTVDAFRRLFEGDWEGFTDGIQEVWEDIWQAIADFLEGLWDMVSPWLEQFWESIKGWFKPEKWLDLGKNVIQGIVDGINAVGMDILNVLGDWVQKAIDWAKSLLGISSPSQVFFDIGENIGQGLINGIRATITDAAAALEALFEAMGNVSGLAGGFGNQFQRRVLDPLRRGVEASQGSIDEMTAALERMATQLGYEEGFLNRPDAILELMRRANYQYATPAEKATAQTMLAFLRERNRLQVQHIQLQRDLAEQEERLALLQEKQAQNDFLQQQLELIKFVKDNNLSADILNGITWGIGADAGALMDAMRRALTQMIAEAQKTLGIASPSRVFREMGMQVNRGLLVGLADNRQVLAAARGMMDEIAAQAVAASFPALAAGGRSANLYGGQHFYFQQPGGSILDDVQRLLAP
ncbi:MAG: hypothetical protein K1X50_21320, partial [Candidatus Promineofilum sp.]|nr:hypothetical protein [Promineifilum sp.]